MLQFGELGTYAGNRECVCLSFYSQGVYESGTATFVGINGPWFVLPPSIPCLIHANHMRYVYRRWTLG